MRANGLRWIGSLALVALGIVLLLNNFLLISGFNVAALSPLILVVLGGAILLRGDLLPGKDARTFGITRGSVEAALLEVNAGEIDVNTRALAREGRLIAGQFAADSRPMLTVQDTVAYLRMERAATPWLSFADWEIGLARDLPWGVYISTSTGQVNLDLTGVIVQRVVVATGLGDIRFVCPTESLDAVTLRSNVGDIRVLTPPGVRARVTLSGGRMFRVHADMTRYDQPQPGVYVAKDGDPAQSEIAIALVGVFGDAYLA
ncbi:MAG: hypothetical protein SGI73_04845 [Chloroflexota bacterium]|nr:hypothetical protein [Chloroflexota bacterium]